MTVDPQRALVIGIDYGTLSGRAVVVRVADGAELGSAVHEYSHAVVDRVLPATGRQLPPDWALQVPGDYLDVLRNAVPAAIAAAGVDPADVVGLGRISPHPPCCRRRPTGRRCASSSSSPGVRTPT